MENRSQYIKNFLNQIKNQSILLHLFSIWCFSNDAAADLQSFLFQWSRYTNPTYRENLMGQKLCSSYYSIFPLECNSYFYDWIDTCITQLCIIFFLINLLKCLFCQGAQIHMCIASMLEFKNESWNTIHQRHQLNVKTSKSRFPIRTNSITISEDST